MNTSKGARETKQFRNSVKMIDFQYDLSEGKFEIFHFYLLRKIFSIYFKSDNSLFFPILFLFLA